MCPGMNIKGVLLVDDEAEFVDTVQERLMTRGIDAQVAHDGEQALMLAEKTSFQVVVLDLKMPGLDGLEVLKKLRHDHPTTQVIMLTGHGSAHEQQAAEKMGIFAYLPKPQNIEVLADRIRQASRIAPKSREAGDSSTPPPKPETNASLTAKRPN